MGLGTGARFRHLAWSFTSWISARGRDELGDIARQGYAVDREEFTLGVSCVAAPVIEGDVARYAYTVSVPIDRFERQRETLITAVLKAARGARTAEVGATA